jgi:sigma-B regulation protein RsbU (phosphoserine phosphatase)
MMTFFLACFDRESKVLTYANASHEAPFLMKMSENAPKKKDLIPLNEVNNPRLGQARDTHYEQTKITLDKGDRVFFYTDGLADIQNPKHEAWGEREFIKGLLVVNKSFPPISESVKQLHELFDSHRQGTPLIDDVTYFMIQVDGGAV